MDLKKLSIVLLALLLAAMAIVPIVSANSTSYSAGTGGVILENNTMTLSGINLKVVKSEAVQTDLKNNNTPLTKEQFVKANQKYIDLLSEKFGKKTALQMADTEYARVTSPTAKLLTANVKTVPSTPRQIGGYDIYLWPYQSQSASQSDPSAGPVTFVIYDNAIDLMSYLSSHGWSVTFLAWDEWGYHGSSSSSLHWTDSNLGTGIWGHMKQGSDVGDRYHVVITGGDYSSSLGTYWAYGNCHHEYYSNGEHVVYANGWNDGRSTLYSTLSGGYSAYWVALYNSVSGYWDGWGQIFQ